MSRRHGSVSNSTAIKIFERRIEWLEKQLLPRKLVGQPTDFYQQEIFACELAIRVISQARDERVAVSDSRSGTDDGRR